MKPDDVAVILLIRAERAGFELLNDVQGKPCILAGERLMSLKKGRDREVREYLSGLLPADYDFLSRWALKSGLRIAARNLRYRAPGMGYVRKSLRGEPEPASETVWRQAGWWGWPR